MAIGAGRYDPECEAIQDSTPGADVVIVLVASATNPQVSGFSASMINPDLIQFIPQLLRDLADQIEADSKKLRN